MRVGDFFHPHAELGLSAILILRRFHEVKASKDGEGRRHLWPLTDACRLCGQDKRYQRRTCSCHSVKDNIILRGENILRKNYNKIR